MLVAATGMMLAVADVVLPGPAPDGATALGLAMFGVGVAGTLLLRSPEVPK